MSISTKFPVAVHVLSLLALNRQMTIYSDFIAGSVNTNPVVIRRVVGLLKKAGMVNSAPGIGGISLIKEPSEISLSAIYQAVTPAESKLFSLHQNTNPDCIIGRNIQSALEESMSNAEKALINELGNETLADILDKLQKHDQLA
ncbi:Rrf2 family transcriptional regulator [Carnobacterium gallinarum]|uniref:Rrf2 family transcriptional regulator n=1 Tax=Carnobacterium gallinarum TaxID=2749 RepID=UPI000550E83A|nr:Rrf2 family transcriptional regulator [Carnobacterium gallinarum]